MYRFKSLTSIVLISAAAFAPISNSHAQNFPTRPIRWIVPVPAGATTDIVTRLVAQKMDENWGQQVIVDNRAGGAIDDRHRHRRQSDARWLHRGHAADSNTSSIRSC